MYYFTKEEKAEKGLSPLAIGTFESCDDVKNNISLLYSRRNDRIVGNINSSWYKKYPYNNTTGLPDIFGEPAITYGYIGLRGIIRWYNVTSELKCTSDYFDISVVLKDHVVSAEAIIKSLPVLKAKIRYNLMVLADLKEELIFDMVTRDGKYINVLCHRKKKERHRLLYTCKS